MPMRPWQNGIALIATFFAAGALLPWSGRMRLVCAFVAFALIAVLLALRLQTHAGAARSRTDADLLAKIERIRQQRARRSRR